MPAMITQLTCSDIWVDFVSSKSLSYTHAHASEFVPQINKAPKRPTPRRLVKDSAGPKLKKKKISETKPSTFAGSIGDEVGVLHGNGTLEAGHILNIGRTGAFFQKVKVLLGKEARWVPVSDVSPLQLSQVSSTRPEIGVSQDLGRVDAPDFQKASPPTHRTLSTMDSASLDLDQTPFYCEPLKPQTPPPSCEPLKHQNPFSREPLKLPNPFFHEPLKLQSPSYRDLTPSLKQTLIPHASLLTQPQTPRNPFMCSNPFVPSPRPPSEGIEKIQAQLEFQKLKSEVLEMKIKNLNSNPPSTPTPPPPPPATFGLPPPPAPFVPYHAYPPIPFAWPSQLPPYPSSPYYGYAPPPSY